MIKKRIKIPIFSGSLTVVVTEDIEAYGKEFRLEVGAYCDAYVFHLGGNIHVVFDTKTINNGIIAHEVVHIVNLVFKYNDVKLDIDNDETQAYLTGWVFEQIEKIISKNE